MLSTRSVASLTAHNVSGVSAYNRANTSADGFGHKISDNFTGQTCHGLVNGNPVYSAIDSSIEDDSQNPAGPITINKGPWGDSFRSLMPAGWTGRIMCTAVFWWGYNSSHPNIGVNDLTASDMQRILQDMWDRGIDCVLVDWYNNTSTNAPSDTLVALVRDNLPSGMKFCVDINQHYITTYNAGLSAAQQQTAIINAINSILNNFAVSPKYERYSGPLVAYQGRPIIPLWDINSVLASGFDWNAVRTGVSGNVNGNPCIIGYQRGGFSMTQSDGAWSWIDTNASISAYMTNDYLPGCAANQNKICMSSVWAGFNGTMTKSVGWSLGKYQPHNGGQTWLDWWKPSSDFVRAGSRLDYVMPDTWDDLEEGSGIQGGIRTDVTINASLAASLVSFAITGTESTVKQYNLWGTTDGNTANLLATLTTSQAKQFNLAALNLTGTYTFYVEALSWPGLQTHVAPQNFTASFNASVPQVIPAPVPAVTAPSSPVITPVAPYVNPRGVRPLDPIFADMKQSGFSEYSIRAMRDLLTRADKTLTDNGAVQSVAPVTGRSEAIGTTVTNLNPDGTFNSTDNVHDGQATLRSYQQSGALSIIDNAGFEAPLINGAIPGWAIGSAAAIALDNGAPQAGNWALKVTYSAAGQAASAVRQSFARPNDTFRISGWLKSDGASTPFLRLTFIDKNGAFLGAAGTAVVSATSFTFVQASLQAPANTVAAVVWLQSNTAGVGWFDSLQGSRTLTSFEVTPNNTAGTPRSTTGLVSQVGVTTAMNVTSSTWQFGDGTVAYNSGSTDPGVLGAYTITGDDPAFVGGAVPLVARSTPADANAANGRLVFGNITTTGGGSVVSTGGGTGGGGPKSKFALV